MLLTACPALLPLHKRTHGSLLLTERMAEVASMTVGADNASKDHPADLGLVAWVAEHWAELLHAVSELALISVRARTDLLPFVTQLRLEHALVVHF